MNKYFLVVKFHIENRNQYFWFISAPTENVTLITNLVHQLMQYKDFFFAGLDCNVMYEGHVLIESHISESEFMEYRKEACNGREDGVCFETAEAQDFIEIVTNFSNVCNII